MRPIICSLIVIFLAGSSQAQTSYSVDFANQTSCGIKVVAYYDVIGNGCASPTNANSLVVASGTTATYSFTVPPGREFCYYMFHASPYTGGVIVYTTGGNPCAWNFAGQDICGDGPPNVAGKGNCTSARFSQ